MVGRYSDPEKSVKMGATKISFEKAVSLGIVDDAFAINKFGRNDDIDGGPEDIWDGGGIWTPPDLARISFLVDRLCPICKLHIDPLVHRLYWCPAAEHLWSLLEEAKAGGIFLIGLSMSMFSRKPPFLMRGMFATLDQMEPFFVPVRFSCVDGPVYFDGSCYFGGTSFARAGYCALQIDGNFRVVKGVFGNVPAPLPQEAGVAKLCAAFAIFEHAWAKIL